MRVQAKKPFPVVSLSSFLPLLWPMGCHTFTALGQYFSLSEAGEVSG